MIVRPSIQSLLRFPTIGGVVVTLVVVTLVVVGCLESLAHGEKASAEKTTEAHTVVLAGGQFQLIAPETWTVKKPRSRIVGHEFAIPAAEGDESVGRLTIMGAGGSIQANVDRWIGQFEQPDGSRTKNDAKVAEKEIAGQKVRFVDLSGTYQDRPRGPFGPAVPRKDYRMLGAIVQTKGKGNFFIKLYGPSKTIASAEEQFQGFVESLQANQ